MKSFQFLLLVLIAFACSCDYVDNPTDGTTEGVNPDPEELTRRVLLMDFTGHKCQNCPSAAAEAKAIGEDFPDNVFILAVHPNISGLSDPNDGEPGEPYTTDWITPEGLDYQSKFEIPNFLPLGVVSGEVIGGNYWTPPASWRPNVESFIQDDREATLELELSYDENSREMSILTDLEILAPLDDSYNLILATVESGIVDWQLDGSTAIQDYEHNHVLRNHINGIQGELINEGPINSGETFSFEHTSSLDTEFVAENVSVYAYIYDTQTLEILDVIEKHLID